ncbi:uncharacterized protein LOC131221987 [Magnolia sinica]|uniref:uncharacterized protein LOC131221987 n=1 Tax=Magnolia sinica TaxID=86752 RepID=UPI0026580C55|nr:uncharacterized protein LOC131221987 [Magnolia sinica]
MDAGNWQPLPDSSYLSFKDSISIQALHLDSSKGSPGVKLNIDGSSHGNPGESGGVGVLRDPHGGVIFAFHRYYDHASNTIVEAQAILDGITLCSKLGFSRIIVESDSKVVVEAAADPSAHCP